MRSVIALAALVLVTVPVHLAAEDHAGHDHEGHAHSAEPGHEEKAPHGGILAEAGGDHLELVHDAAAGRLTLHVLDGALKAHPITAKPLTVQTKPAGATALVPVVLTPATDGQASEFSGAADALKGVAALEVIVRVELDGKGQRVVFAIPVAASAGHAPGDGHQH